MPTSRSYADACGIARALDVVGERWALLLVRELLLGPQRFSDLRRALPGASSNLVTDRLRELQGRGVISRRRLPPPAASDVYELTAWGRELEPILLALGGWGLRVPRPAGSTLSATSVLLYLRGSIDPGEHTYRVELDDRIWTVRSPAEEGPAEEGPAEEEPAEEEPAGEEGSSRAWWASRANPGRVKSGVRPAAWRSSRVSPRAPTARFAPTPRP